MPTLLADTDTVAVEVSVVATVVVISLVAALAYLLACARRLRNEAHALARDVESLLRSVEATVRQAERDVARVDRMVGSAEAINDAMGSASKLVGGVVATPLIKAVAFGSGLVHGARTVRTPPVPEPAPARRRLGRRSTRRNALAPGTAHTRRGA